MAQEIAKKEDDSLKVEQQPLHGYPEWHQFHAVPAKKCERISEVIIKAGDVVDSLEFVMLKPKPGGGWTSTRHKFGGPGGGAMHVVLKPGEYMTHVSGATARYGGFKKQVVTRLRLHTNLQPGGYGPMGSGQSCHSFSNFTSPLPADSKLVGFHGWYLASDYIRAIGVYTAKRDIVKEGPYGSKLSQNWEMNLGANESIKEVIIRHGDVVNAIGFVIGNDKKFFGGSGGVESKITLKPGEYITQISGTSGEYSFMCNGVVIATLKIHTNLNPAGYGPYGTGRNVKCVAPFSSTTSGRVLGFFGRHHDYLESIGVKIEKEFPCPP